jgi:hypothetical protein
MAKWTGWWVQRGLGRNSMYDLVLDIAPDGRVTGGGVDCIGEFTFEGHFRNNGTVSLDKRYIGRHRVFYEGCNSGEGIFGTWSIPGFNRGRFALRPIAETTSDRAAIQQLTPK